MQRVDHGAGAVGGAEPALGGERADDVRLNVKAADTREAQRLVEGELRPFEGVPGEDEPRR